MNDFEGKGENRIREIVESADEKLRDVKENADIRLKEIRETADTRFKVAKKRADDTIDRINLFRVYIIRLCIRVMVLLGVAAAYFFRPKYFNLIMTEHLKFSWQLKGLTLEELYSTIAGYNGVWVVVVWAIFMISMMAQFIPDNMRITMGSRKRFVENYEPTESIDELAMFKYMRIQNIRAMRVLVVWFCFNAIFGALYVFDIIGSKELILLTACYYVCDLICVVIWCPFQSFFMKNKCCVNCRIFNWGHIMMFTPLLFIRNFFTWSLFFMSLMIMIKWEVTVQKHPERFWEGSNAVLKCENCHDKMCKIKGPKFIKRCDTEEKTC